LDTDFFWELERRYQSFGLEDLAGKAHMDPDNFERTSSFLSYLLILILWSMLWSIRGTENIFTKTFPCKKENAWFRYWIFKMLSKKLYMLSVLSNVRSIFSHTHMHTHTGSISSQCEEAMSRSSLVLECILRYYLFLAITLG
jgi:hypothetical protein